MAEARRLAGPLSKSGEAPAAEAGGQAAPRPCSRSFATPPPAQLPLSHRDGSPGDRIRAWAMTIEEPEVRAAALEVADRCDAMGWEAFLELAGRL